MSNFFPIIHQCWVSLARIWSDYDRQVASLIIRQDCWGVHLGLDSRAFGASVLFSSWRLQFVGGPKSQCYALEKAWRPVHLICSCKSRSQQFTVLVQIIVSRFLALPWFGFILFYLQILGKSSDPASFEWQGPRSYTSENFALMTMLYHYCGILIQVSMV